MQFSEVKYMPERSKFYMGGPSLVRLREGTLVASHYYFYNGDNRHLNVENALNSIYRSEDDGKTWQQVNHILGSFWGTLFLRGEELYHLSCSREWGDILLRRSIDGGFTWTTPSDEKHGLLFRGGPGYKAPNYQCGDSTPVLFHNSRIYKTLEDLVIGDSAQETHRPENFQALAISVRDDADLLDASNWTMSNKLKFDAQQVKDVSLLDEHSGWLESSPVVDPEGKLHSVIRIQLTQPNKAAILDLSDDGKELSFNYDTGIIDFIGGRSKFTLRYDPVSGMYFTISNYVRKGASLRSRNLLCLGASEDLRNWKNLGILLFDDTGLEPKLSEHLTGFQSASWQFDGDDIIYLSRTAYRGAKNMHDANRITYHVIRDFRKHLDPSTNSLKQVTE